MKGIDFGRMTPERMGELIAAATRQLEVMNQNSVSHDAMKKNLLPAMQRMRQARYELQIVVDQMIDKTEGLDELQIVVDRMIDKTADLEKRISQMEKVLSAIFDQDAGNEQ
ncbi:hypothetical protein FNH71_18715 [Salmonella enterica subsp. diarizonae]|nr:hypothetical protein [Salmonella enterica subsp. diarizonae]